MYKLTDDSILTDKLGIPIAEGNRHYQQFIRDVAEQGIEIVEGADVVEPDYVALRTGPEGYASTGEQFGMQTDGTWDAHIADVKARFPKTITGGTTIAPVPAWVQEKADAWKANHPEGSNI
jgi:hypothetical protein